MTAEKRAREIADSIVDKMGSLINRTMLSEEITAALVAYGEEIRGERDKAFVGMMHRAKREGHQRGLAEAAEIADKYIEGRNRGSAAVIADEIRGLGK